MGNWIKQHVKKNPASMSNSKARDPLYRRLPPSQAIKEAGFDYCCGIHGIARERKGIKKATSRQRRIQEKEIIQQQLEEMGE